ncbi:hypothetical protein AcV5_008225 [Taiwanofungus camphoratus]|nr:hypothetical protein AcV5_008225 [Antrodia cinnamomea]
MSPTGAIHTESRGREDHTRAGYVDSTDGDLTNSHSAPTVRPSSCSSTASARVDTDVPVPFTANAEMAEHGPADRTGNGSGCKPGSIMIDTSNGAEPKLRVPGPTISSPSKLRKSRDDELPPLPGRGSTQPGLFKRFTSKLRSPTTQQDNPALQKRNTALRLPSLPKAPQPSTLPNSFVSPASREAALRARGLIPADPLPLSEQERERDKRCTVLLEEKVVNEQTGDGEETEAKRIREAWLARNREESPSERGPPVPSKDPPLSPAGDVTERVARWLQSSSSSPSPVPTLTSGSPRPARPTHGRRTTGSSGDLSHLAKGPVPPSAFKPCKEKSVPIVVTIPSSPEPHETPSPAITVSTRGSSSSESSEQQLQPRPLPETSARGRSAAVSNVQSLQSKAPVRHTASGSTGSHSEATMRTLPALSPTRTTSSSALSLAPATPTTGSHFSGSQSQSRTFLKPQRPKIKIPGSNAHTPLAVARNDKNDVAVFVESPAEEDGSYVKIESGLDSGDEKIPAARPRPRRPGQPANKERRTSFGIFIKKATPARGEVSPLFPSSCRTFLSFLAVFSDAIDTRSDMLIIHHLSPLESATEAATRVQLDEQPPALNRRHTLGAATEVGACPICIYAGCHGQPPHPCHVAILRRVTFATASFFDPPAFDLPLHSPSGWTGQYVLGSE